MGRFLDAAMAAILLLALICFTDNAGASEVLPVGHLLPFGGHRQPDSVEERPDFPSAEEFMEKYVRKSKHVVFRGAAKNFPAFKLWTEEYLKTKYPSMELRLEAKKEKHGFVPVGAAGVGRDTMENFINIFHDTNRYIVSELPTPMWDEVSVLPCMSCGMFKKNMIEVDIWMSGGDSSSIIHKDAFNTMNCLLNGTKEWKFIDYKYENEIYKAWEPDNQIGGFSKVNPEAVDLLKYPTVQEVPWSFSRLEAGDCVFLPGSMYHQVKSFGSMNVAVALLFSRFEYRGANVSRFHDCENEVFRPLSEFDVDWQYPGVGKMTMGNSELRTFRQMVYDFTQEGKVSLQRIEEHVKEVYENRFDTYKNARSQLIYELLTNITGSEKLTKKDIFRLTKAQLRVIGDAIQPDEPSNTYNYEFSYVRGEDIRNVIKQLVIKEGGLKLDSFVEFYQNVCMGSKKFGQRIFKELGGTAEKMSLTKEDIQQTIFDVTGQFDEDRSTDFYRDDPKFEFGDAYEHSSPKIAKRVMTNDEWEKIDSDKGVGMESEEDGVYMDMHEEKDMPTVADSKDEF